MGVTTGGSVQESPKKCEVKLERLSPSTSLPDTASGEKQQRKRPRLTEPNGEQRTTTTKTEEVTSDLRPPVKLTVKLGSNNNTRQAHVVKSSLSGEEEYPPSSTTASSSSSSSSSSSRKPTNLPLSVQMSSAQLREACERLGHDDGNISTSVYVDRTSSASLPCNPPQRPTTALTKEELLPMTPSVYVKTGEEAFSPQLLDICLRRPIVLVRNLAPACDLDLSLYSTKTLVETHPNHPVEIRTQMEQTSDENWEPTMERPVWYCTSSRSHTTISKYAEYQAASIEEAMLEKDIKAVNPEYDFKDESTRRMIKFGTNCDLSDEKKWGPQLKELNKLPAWSRVVSAGNMLSHIGNQILGMNTVQLYMKVPCARTPGHQENNNFCAININIGPGDSEWFGVPNDYWGALQNLCAKNKVDYLHGSWWPKMEELYEAGIPTYRFMQRPGDLVWVNVGCVHWVQAAGWCNNIAWNVGPLTHRQYTLALERYEWNKSQRFQSIVAMVLLSWNLARNVQVTDVDLRNAIKSVLQQSIRITIQNLAYVRSKGIRTRLHGRRKNEPAHYCGQCDEEVFNTLFVKESEKRHVVHCLRCTRALDKDLKGIICLEEYTLEELLNVYDNF